MIDSTNSRSNKDHINLVKCTIDIRYHMDNKVINNLLI